MFARRQSNRLSSTLEQRPRISSALMLHFFSCTSRENWVRTPTTSFKLAIEIFSIRKPLISDHFDKLAFSLNKRFTDDVLFSHAGTLTGCPLDANNVTFRAYRRLICYYPPRKPRETCVGMSMAFSSSMNIFYRMYQACMWSYSLDLLLLPGLWPPHSSPVAYVSTLEEPSQASTREP